MAAVAFLATVAVFAPSARFEFVDYDDRLYVIENEHMREGLTVGNAAWAFASRGYADNWHPLTWISLQADVSALRTWERLTGKLYDEEEFLIREAMSKEPDNERAKKMLELIETRRKETERGGGAP